MELRTKTRKGKVVHVAFLSGSQATAAYASPSDAHYALVGGMRRGRLNPAGYDLHLRKQMREELDAIGFTFDLMDLEPYQGSKSHMLAAVTVAMAEQGLPPSVICRFAQVATCAPHADAAWALA